jgi:integrase
MGQRKRGRKQLPKGLYTDKVKGKIYWRIRLQKRGKRINRTLGAMSEEEAIAKYFEFMANPDEDDVSDSNPSISLTEFLETIYLPHVEEHRAAGTFKMEAYAARWLRQYFKATRLEAVDSEAIEAYKRWRRTHGGRRGKEGPRLKPSARTINLDLITLSKALKFAVRLALIERAPPVIRLPEARERKETRWLSAEQVAKVLDAVSERRYLLLIFAFHTGMRPGEITTREKRDIDLERGFVRIGHRGKFHVKRDRPRTVPLTPALQKALEERWNDLPVKGPIFAGQSMKNVLRRTCKAAGVPVISPYGTRHSFASRWAVEGRSKDALIKLMGHRDGRMIDRVYAHFGSAELADHVVRVNWESEGDVVQMRRRAPGEQR